MTDTPEYAPPKVWSWTKPNGGRFENINRPTAGATHEKELPVGRHPLQLYSLGTPNGVKVTIMLEELLALGHKGAEYDAWLIKIGDGDQFGSGFVAINPNSKIPALVDRSGPTPIRVFETGAILMYLAEKHGRFLPADRRQRYQAVRTRHKPQNRQGVKHDIVAPLRGHDLPRQEQIRRTVRFERKHECRRAAVAANLVQFF